MAGAAGAIPAGWYVDEDLLDVYRVLKSARRRQDDVHGVPCACDICPDKSSKDIEWLPLLRDSNWAIITHDGFQSVGEREAVLRHGLAVFRLKWRGTLYSWDRVRLVFTKWDEMLKVWETEPRPYIANITRNRSPRMEFLE